MQDRVCDTPMEGSAVKRLASQRCRALSFQIRFLGPYFMKTMEQWQLFLKGLDRVAQQVRAVWPFSVVCQSDGSVAFQCASQCGLSVWSSCSTARKPLRVSPGGTSPPMTVHLPAHFFTYSNTNHAAGEVRIGIFAKEDIPAGTEVTYDYMFQHHGLAAAAAAYRCELCPCALL